jgi:hypothetical protein
MANPKIRMLLRRGTFFAILTIAVATTVAVGAFDVLLLPVHPFDSFVGATSTDEIPRPFGSSVFRGVITKDRSAAGLSTRTGSLKPDFE